MPKAKEFFEKVHKELNSSMWKFIFFILVVSSILFLISMFVGIKNENIFQFISIFLAIIVIIVIFLKIKYAYGTLLENMTNVILPSIFTFLIILFFISLIPFSEEYKINDLYSSLTSILIALGGIGAAWGAFYAANKAVQISKNEIINRKSDELVKALVQTKYHKIIFNTNFPIYKGFLQAKVFLSFKDLMIEKYILGEIYNFVKENYQINENIDKSLFINKFLNKEKILKYELLISDYYEKEKNELLFSYENKIFSESSIIFNCSYHDPSNDKVEKLDLYNIIFHSCTFGNIYVQIIETFFSIILIDKYIEKLLKYFNEGKDKSKLEFQDFLKYSKNDIIIESEKISALYKKLDDSTKFYYPLQAFIISLNSTHCLLNNCISLAKEIIEHKFSNEDIYSFYEKGTCKNKLFCKKFIKIIKDDTISDFREYYQKIIEEKIYFCWFKEYKDIFSKIHSEYRGIKFDFFDKDFLSQIDKCKNEEINDK